MRTIGIHLSDLRETRIRAAEYIAYVSAYFPWNFTSFHATATRRNDTQSSAEARMFGE